MLLLEDGVAQDVSAFTLVNIPIERAEKPLFARHPIQPDVASNERPFDGRVYILTSGNTFSAAIVSIAFAKESADDRTIIVGEEIGDRLQFWAEGWLYDLPNSGFRARYATAFYDLQHGCRGLFRCYWGAFFLFPVIVDDLDVDIPAPLTFEAYASGRDPAWKQSAPPSKQGELRLDPFPSHLGSLAFDGVRMLLRRRAGAPLYFGAGRRTAPEAGLRE